VEGETFTIQPVNRLNQLIDFHLVPYQEGRADMIKEVFDGISAELKNSLPLNTNKQQTKENNEMKNTKKVFESFNSMNRMGMQMMKNVMGRMGQMYGNNCTNDMPFNGMPDFTKMMDGMKQMNEKAAENMKSMNDKAFAGMNVMNQKMTEKLPEAQEAAQQMAQAMVPTMRQQMNQMIGCMRQMNAAALQMMQMSFEQNVKLMNQIMDSVEKMAGTAPAETPAAEAAAPEAPAAEAPKEAKKAEKKPGKKKAAKAAKE
jgi:paraquat-inducible protein B